MKFPKGSIVKHKSVFYGHNSAINDCAKAIRVAGFTVEGDE